MTSLSRAIRSQSLQIVKFVVFGLQIRSNYERTCDLTDVPASIYDRKKTGPDLLTPFTTFYVSVSCNHFSEAEMRQFGASGNQSMRLSGTDELIFKFVTMSVKNR